MDGLLDPMQSHDHATSEGSANRASSAVRPPYFLLATLVVISLLPGAPPVAAQAVAPDAATVRQQFQSPAKQYRPLVRWWWPGNDVTETELRREVDVLDRAGFGGAEIQPFAIGLAAKKLPAADTKRVNDYPSPGFFRNVGAAADQAKKDGLYVDYTFGSGWPFGGGADITPELSSVELRSSHQTVYGPQMFHARLQLPKLTDGDPLDGGKILKGLPEGWAERAERRTRLVAVVALRGTDTQYYANQVPNREQAVEHSGELHPGTAIDLTARLQPDGTLDWDVPEGTWQLFVFRSVPTLHKVVGAAGEGPQLEMDHFSTAAFAAHAKRVGDDAVPELQNYFGNGIRAIFCDSLEVRANLYWSDDFLAEFRRRRGYDLTPYLPVLKVQGYGGPFNEYENLPPFEMPGIGDQIRRDYRQTLSDLMIERFFNPFNTWAHQHHMLARTQAHGAPADILRVYGEADIPETEVLYDTGRYDFLKMAASSAHVYGRPIVGSESFVWRNAVYQTTPEHMKVASDELLTAGINAILYHGFPYVLPNLPAPGWHPFTGAPTHASHSSQFNELNPFWPYLAQLNAYITRVQYISQAGVNVAAIALFQPELAHGAKDAPPPTPPVSQHLMDAGYNYDHINVDSLLHSSIHDRRLLTAAGTGYAALVLPSLNAIDAALAEKLVTFARAGLPIVFTGNVPQAGDSFEDRTARTDRVAAAMKTLHQASSVVFVSGSSHMQGSGSAADQTVAAVARTVPAGVHFTGQPFPFFEKTLGPLHAFFLRNATDDTQPLSADFAATGTPELWDPWTGKSSPLAFTRGPAGSMHLSLPLAPFGSALIVFDASHPAAASPAAPPASRMLRSIAVGGAGWDLTATSIDRTGQDGKPATLHRNLPQLIDFSLDAELRSFSGKAVYRTTVTLSPQDIQNRLLLDLGAVADVAEVSINGKHVTDLLMRPYTADVTAFLHPGENQLEVAVSDALFNSMVLRSPRTFGAGHTDLPSGLMSAGLIGPVQIRLTQ